MKKRLCKKKRIGEFKELGFEVRGDLRPGLSGDDIEAFDRRQLFRSVKEVIVADQ